MIETFTILMMAQNVVVIPPTVTATMKQDTDVSPWHIISEGGQYSDETVPLTKGAVIARQRLVPKQLFVLEGVAERADGKDRWAQGGDQLFGVRVADTDAYCVLKSKINLTVKMFLVPTKSRVQKQDCFVDIDGDGKLDKRFEADPGSGVLPNVARSEPKAFYPLTPVAYSKLDSTKFADESWVSIEYRGGGKTERDPPILLISYRYDGKVRKLSDRVSGSGKPFPAEFEILGSHFRLTKDEGGRLAAKVLKPMDSEFGVITTFVIR